MKQDAQKKTLITFYNLLQANGWINYSFSIFAASQSFLGPVLILESRLAAFTKKIKPTKPDIPKIAVLHDLLAWQGDVSCWTECKIESSNNRFFRCVSYSAWPSWLPWRVPSVSWENALIMLYVKTVLLRRAKRASPRILATSPKFSLHAVESMR